MVNRTAKYTRKDTTWEDICELYTWGDLYTTGEGEQVEENGEIITKYEMLGKIPLGRGIFNLYIGFNDLQEVTTMYINNKKIVRPQ